MANERFRFIYEYRNRWFVNIMCDILNVSEIGYYKAIKGLGRPSKDALLSTATIQEVMNESSFNDNYGVPRMKLALEQ